MLKHRTTFVALAVGVLLSACGGDGDEPEETRPQDSRTFSTGTVAPTFAPMAAAAGDVVDMSTTSRWSGVREGAAYHVEVPANWNGKLVMYAHGYAGNGNMLGVSDPSIRRHLIQQGYAWAASSYSKNYYDVRAGVEDTNALALAFNDIATANGRSLAKPSKIYITGHSMGGHVTAAAVEQETLDYANNKVHYDGAVPMCGVVGDRELFNEFGAMQMAAQALTGYTNTPRDQWASIVGSVTGQLFSQFPDGGGDTKITPTALGMTYLSVVKNLTGGERPMFTQGWAFGGSFPSTWGIAFNVNSALDGVLTEPVIDTTKVTYVIDGDAAGSAALNASAQRLQGDPEANRLRRDGLRWVPQVNGKFSVPVVSIHTLGDLFVPFSMEQTYAQRAAAGGSSGNLVQRAIRGVSHCDFTVAEQVEAFDAMIQWETAGIKPAGDDVLTAATVAAPTYGCAYTRDVFGADDGAAVKALRAGIAQTGGSCP
ncbi:alpha/beta hydrolase [Ottowia sp. VDI28]|uniref:alpha/beta hydrolase n=1 Tax=Ottowia sp. VDI28 TaxID=3133968 RepID=UPI003C2B44B2